MTGELLKGNIDIVARTAWGEARGQGMDGLAAVCNVIRNRVSKPGWWGHDWVGVCKAPQQFSCWNAGDPNLVRMLKVTPDDPYFADALVVARAQVQGCLRDRTRGATHYHATSVHPWWARGQKPVVTIGDHVFYRGVE